MPATRVHRACLWAPAAALATATLSCPAQVALSAHAGARSGSGFQQAGSGAPIDMSDTAAVTLAIEGPLDAARPWQLRLSHQLTRLDLGAPASPGAPSQMPLRLSYLHLGGLNFIDGRAGRGTYVAGGLGFTHMSPQLPGTSARLRASMNLGLGHEWALRPKLALRAELRGYATLIRSEGAFFCSGGCSVSIRGDALTQAELNLGLVLGF